jgi:sulfonate transport system permease protein
MSAIERVERMDARPVASPRRPSNDRSVWTLLTSAAQPWIVPGLVLIAWQAAAGLGWLTSRVLPSPAEVGRAAYRLAVSGELTRHVAVSARRAALGFFLGGGIGLAFGLLNGLSRTAERLFDTTLQMARAVPHLALVPLFILWLGIGDVAKVALVALAAMFPLYLNTLHGLRSIDPRLVEMARVHGLGRWGMVRRVILPGALPSILVGVRYGLGVMWLTLIVAETISADAGIGYLAMNAREFLQADIVMVAILLYALLGKLADLATRLLERWLLPWHATLGTRRPAR